MVLLRLVKKKKLGRDQLFQSISFTQCQKSAESNLKKIHLLSLSFHDFYPETRTKLK